MEAGVQRRWVCLPLGLIVLFTSTTYARNRVGDIEFFGYKGISTPSQLRKEIPIRVGDALTPQKDALVRLIERLHQAIKSVTRHEPTDVSFVCCDANGDFTIFIGLPGSTSQEFSYNPAPKSNERLPKDLTDLYHRLDKSIEAAIRRGGTTAQEDDSHGYALIHDPAARALQLQMRKYALRHESELLRVLKDSSYPEQRRISADAIGYMRQSHKQIFALVWACRDPDAGVRNNATRALGVLALSRSQLADQIPPEPFIEMLKSGVWTDRNKAGFVLMGLTRARPPALLAELRTKALDSLIEMAKWRDIGHAYDARVLLGRIAGIPEKKLEKEALQRSPQPILGAVATHMSYM
jgi:hypothetical protein